MSNTTHITLAPERFYWSLVDDTPGLTSRAAQATLRALIEPDLPDDQIEVHVVAGSLSDGRVLLCAIDTASLAEISDDTLSLTPALLPAFIDASTIDPRSLNLLIGAFEPRVLRQERHRRRRTTLIAAVAAMVALCLGLERRVNYWRAQSDHADAAANAMLRSVDDSPSPGVAYLHAKDELDVLRRSQHSVDAGKAARSTPDAAIALAALLEQWPADRNARTESISISPGVATVNVTMAQNPKEFLAAFHPPGGWQLDEPHLSTSRDTTQLTLQLRRTGGAQ